MSNLRLRLALLTLFVTIAGSLANPAPATAAVIFRDASAGGTCQAANGALAAKFNFNLTFLTNAGTTDAYVICNLPMDDAINIPQQINKLEVHVQLPNAGTTISCLAQVSSYFDGENHIYYSSTKSYTSVGPNASTSLIWTSADLQRPNVWQVLSFNCKLPPGAKLGLIERWEGTEG